MPPHSSSNSKAPPAPRPIQRPKLLFFFFFFLRGRSSSSSTGSCLPRGSFSAATTAASSPAGTGTASPQPGHLTLRPANSSLTFSALSQDGQENVMAMGHPSLLLALGLRI